MSVFDTLARWLGLSEPPIPGGGTQGQPSVAAALPTWSQPKSQPAAAQGVHDPYAALWESVDRHLAVFMAKSVLPHRHYAPSDLFKLACIQVAGTSTATQKTLDNFLNEFRPEIRRKVVLIAVKRTCAEGVSTDDFVDFNRDFDQEQLEASDPYAAQLSDANQGGYRVTLFGEWALQQPVPTVAGAYAKTIGTPGAPLQADVHDAKGQRRIEISEFPFIVGREASNSEQALAGTYLSRRHGVIERDVTGQTWYRDTSVNGSSLDGAPVMSGERRQLHDGSRLMLGGEGASIDDCPLLRIHSGAGAQGQSKTPLRQPQAPAGPPNGSTPLRTPMQSAASTPIAGMASPSAGQRTLCMLAIQDSHGSRTVAVTHVPFVIGRDEKADCRIPEGNSGVSRQHLVIQAVVAAGALIANNGAEQQRWGTESGGVEQPSQFLLAWNQHATLAYRYASAPPVKLQLLTAHA